MFTNLTTIRSQLQQILCTVIITLFSPVFMEGSMSLFFMNVNRPQNDIK